MKRFLLVMSMAIALPLLMAAGCRSTVAYFSRTSCICEKRSACICKGTARRAECECPKRPSCRCGTKMVPKGDGKK